MAKETFYFTHDYNARNDDKILEMRSVYGAEGYGIFWMIVETMAENKNGGVKASLIGGLSLGYGIPKHKLLEIMAYCIEIGLFFENDGYYYSQRLLTHKEYRKSLVEWGEEGAKKRWAGYSPPNAKERKGNKNKIKGVSFSEEKDAVIFDDGSKQKLGSSQKILLDNDSIKPEDIPKGHIV